ncbi:MAG TPA: recombinase family protein [Stellaceae bacterium]|nr:recombinase family protein [Stellaceae bacterium]
MSKFISYLRISTAKGGGAASLGIEAQRQSVAGMVGLGGVLLHEYVEVLSGKRDDRPELAKAIQHATAAHAGLICSKLDRIGRHAAHVLTLLDDAKKAGVSVIFADNPNAGKLTLGILAIVAEAEADAISRRTIAALQAAKSRGVRLGNPNGAAALRRYQEEHGIGARLDGIQRAADDFASDLRFAADALIAKGVTTLAGIAAGLNEQSFPSRRGGRWYASSVALLVKRLGITLS